MFWLVSYFWYIPILDLQFGRNIFSTKCMFFVFNFCQIELEIHEKRNGNVVRVLIWIRPVLFEIENKDEDFFWSCRTFELIEINVNIYLVIVLVQKSLQSHTRLSVKLISLGPVDLQTHTIFTKYLPPAEACVKNSVHRGRGACVAGGACIAGGACMAGGHAWLGGYVWQGACMVGGHAWQGGMHGRGACMAGEGVCMADTTRYGQWAGGTHPTGMHSCYINFFWSESPTGPIDIVHIVPKLKQIRTASGST